MKFTPKQFKKFLLGGTVEQAVPEEQMTALNAPMQEGQEMQEGQGGLEDPMMMLAQAAALALQTQDCQIALQVCLAFLQMLQQAMGLQAPEEPQGEPVFRKGGVLSRRIRK